MARLIRPPKSSDVTAFMRMLFLKTEQELINEIKRKRKKELIDYAEVASLERVQRILQDMMDESWSYVPAMIETIFYHSEKHANGYRNARTLTSTQTAIVQQLSNNLLGEIMEASDTAYKSVKDMYTIGRLEKDPFREAALKETLSQQAAGSSWTKASVKMVREMENQGVTAFVDKAGRQWSLSSYGNMAVRTTARQAQVAAMLTADDYDLWQIVKIGSTCPVCAALEGRVYSKSGTNPDYPPLSLAFGKIDPAGGGDLTNTYMNIHPNCLHSFVKYTTMGKTEKQIQKDKDFSNPEKNPLNRDPRTKKQIAAYREKERARQRYLRDKRQHREYRSILGNEVPKDFAKFQEMKYNNPRKWNSLKLSFRRKNNLNTGFSSLQEPLQLKHVKQVLSEMGISYGDAKVKIIRNPDLIGGGFFGWTNPNGKEIQLYPDCFISREELVKTLGHERVHLEQLKLWGPAKTNEEAVFYEKGPRFSEEYWWSEYRRKTNYDGKRSG